MSESACLHCGTLTGHSQKFCCRGCEVVFSILQERGLAQEYYELRKTGTRLRAPTPAPDPSQSYSYLDDSGFKKLYASSDAEDRMCFYLEGVHCAACVWLLEKVPEFTKEATQVSIDLSRSTAAVKIPPGGSFAKVASEFHRLGYRPHPVRGGEGEEIQKKENRRMLMRIGVAGACTGNIMLLAVSVYGGASGKWAEIFNWVSFLLFLPVALFSATPFYKDAWAALRARAISIDIPIVLGVLLGALASLFNLLQGSAHVYFDSLSALVFLLLSSRHVLRKAQQDALQSSRLIHFLTPSTVRKLNPENGQIEEAALDLVSPGDRVEVRAGEPIPIDGVVLSGSSNLNCALLTGESELIAIRPGMPVFAGTINEDSRLEIQVSASGYETRLGRIIREVEQGTHRKAPIVQLADKISKGFVAAVLLLAGGVFFWGLFGQEIAWTDSLNRALAMVIVTCPCALALATPLAMSVSIGRAARAGFLIKGADVIERLSQVRSVILDKTGTLTTGAFQVLEWKTAREDLSEGEKKDLSLAAFALESRSNHPVARAIVRYFSPFSATSELRPSIPEVEDFHETIGKGVEGRIGGHFYEIRQSDAQKAGSSVPSGVSGTRVTLYRDSVAMAHAVLGDRVREDSKTMVENLKSLGLDVWILSGDHEEAVQKTAAYLGIPPNHAISRASPEAKREFLRRHPQALMAGDGANDAIALSAAYVSAAVHGGMEISLRAADTYLTIPGAAPIHRLILISRETMKVLHRNLAFSLLYNVAGGGAALLGWVDPLFAAVLMPASAFTVFISSILGTRGLRTLMTQQPGRRERRLEFSETVQLKEARGTP